MLIAGSIAMICGVVFFILGITFFVLEKKTWKSTVQTEGRVVDMCMNAIGYNNGKSVRTGESGTGNRCPIYSYYVNGREYRRASNVAYNKGYVRSMMNKPVMVYYNPENPEQFCLGKMTAFAFVGIVFCGLGVLFMGMGMVFIVVGI